MNWNRLIPRGLFSEASLAGVPAGYDEPPAAQTRSRNGNHSADASSRLAWDNHLGYQAALAHARRAMRRADWTQAESLLMRAGTIACEDAAFYNLVGVLWEVKGDQTAAGRSYGKAIRANSNYAPAQQNMRRLYELWTFGRTREAVALGDEIPDSLIAGTSTPPHHEMQGRVER